MRVLGGARVSICAVFFLSCGMVYGDSLHRSADKASDHDIRIHEFFSHYLTFLSSNDDAVLGVYEEAAEAYFSEYRQEVLPLLTMYACDSDLNTRLSAIYALGVMGESAASAIPLLIEALDDVDASIRAQALRTLGRMGAVAEVALPYMIPKLEDDSYVVAIFAYRVLPGMGDKAVQGIIDYIVERMRSPSIEDRWRAITIMSELKRLGTRTETFIQTILRRSGGMDLLINMNESCTEWMSAKYSHSTPSRYELEVVADLGGILDTHQKSQDVFERLIGGVNNAEVRSEIYEALTIYALQLSEPQMDFLVTYFLNPRNGKPSFPLRSSWERWGESSYRLLEKYVQSVGDREFFVWPQGAGQAVFDFAAQRNEIARLRASLGEKVFWALIGSGWTPSLKDTNRILGESDSLLFEPISEQNRNDIRNLLLFLLKVPFCDLELSDALHLKQWLVALYKDEKRSSQMEESIAHILGSLISREPSWAQELEPLKNEALSSISVKP